MNKLYKKYKKQNFVLLTLNTNGPNSITKITKYQHKFNYTFPILINSETAILKHYNPQNNIPFSIMIDQHGQIIKTHQDFNPKNKIPLKTKLKRLLTQTPPTTSSITKKKSTNPEQNY